MMSLRKFKLIADTLSYLTKFLDIITQLDILFKKPYNTSMYTIDFIKF